jgi:hypothetical protein
MKTKHNTSQPKAIKLQSEEATSNWESTEDSYWQNRIQQIQKELARQRTALLQSWGMTSYDTKNIPTLEMLKNRTAHLRENTGHTLYLLQPITHEWVTQLIPEIIQWKHRTSEPTTLYLDCNQGDPQVAEKLVQILKTPKEENKPINLITVVVDTASGTAAGKILANSDLIIAYPHALIQNLGYTKHQITARIATKFLACTTSRVTKPEIEGTSPAQIIAKHLHNPTLKNIMETSWKPHPHTEPNKLPENLVAAYKRYRQQLETQFEATKHDMESQEIQDHWCSATDICLKLQKENPPISGIDALYLGIADRSPGTPNIAIPA